MPLANIYRCIQDLEGNVVTGVLCTVTLSGTSTLAALFADAEGTLPLPNPTTNNAQYGTFSLFVGAGTYTMQFVKAGYTFETQYNITMRDPAAGVNTITGTANRVIVNPVPGVGTVTLSTPQDIAPDSTLQFGHLGIGTPGNASYGLDVSTASRFTGTLNASTVAITGGSAVLTGGLNMLNYGATNASGIYIQQNSAGGTNRWALNCAGDAPNFMAGWLRVPQLGIGGALDLGGQVTLTYDKTAKWGLIILPTGSDGGGFNPVLFKNVAGGGVGSITTNGSGTAYNTSSDARLKHAIAPLAGALDVVTALRPVRFRWLADDSDGVGFLAQEVAEHVQGVITGELDAVDEEGRIVPQMIDMSKLMPWIVGAMQTIVQRLEVVEDAAGV